MKFVTKEAVITAMESHFYDSLNTTEVNWAWKKHFANVLGTTLIVVLLTIMTLGIAGNTLVLYIICKHREMQTATNLYIANLAAADLIMLVVCIISVAVTSNMIVLNKITCKILEYITHVSTGSQSILMVYNFKRMLKACVFTISM